ncbi:Maf family protein [Psychrobacter glacincola]|uniref:Maf family protein n=1 Tax=Psychrobacter glacincola TaxID=56810 RepID=UPI0039B04A1E
MDIILASGSPRRRELLSRAQLEFTIISVDIDETPYRDESPKDYIVRMVVAKAEAATAKLNTQSKNNEAQAPKSLPSQPIILLTSDTIGVLPDGKTVLVKPSNREDAYHMWQQMSDNTHEVWTAVQATKLLLQPKHPNQADSERILKVINQQQILERTEVTFVALTKEMMSEYWDSGEPADKAGGYGIQGLGAAWVSRINGSYTNVVGLPLAQTLALIKDMNNTATL